MPRFVPFLPMPKDHSILRAYRAMRILILSAEEAAARSEYARAKPG